MYNNRLCYTKPSAFTIMYSDLQYQQKRHSKRDGQNLKVALHSMIATTLFRRFRPNAVSSEFTLTMRSSGSEVCPSATMVIRQGFEVLRISLLNRQHKP